MIFVKNLEALGVKIRQTTDIVISGPPTTDTEGDVGCTCQDSLTGKRYKCVALNEDGKPVWVEIKEGGVASVNGVLPDENGNVEVETCGVASVNGTFPDADGNVEINIGNVIIGNGAPPFDPDNTEIEAGKFYYDRAKRHLWLCLQKSSEDSGNGSPPTNIIEWANLDWFDVKSVNGNYPDENGNVEIEVGGDSNGRYIVEYSVGEFTIAEMQAIAEVVDSGREVVMLLDIANEKKYFQLVSKTLDDDGGVEKIVFATLDDPDRAHYVIIGKDGVVTESYPTVGGGAMSRYVIDIETGHFDDEGNEVLGYSGTFDDIVQHYEAGDEIVINSAYEGSANHYTRLVKVGYNDGIEFFVFAGLDSNGQYCDRYAIYRDGDFFINRIRLYDVDALGDISTALDHIIALQDSLIGGDSV